MKNKLTHTIAAGLCAFAMLPSGVSAKDDTKTRIADLEYDVSELSKTLRAMTNRMRVDGFLTAGISYSTEEVPLNFSNTRDELDFTAISLAGLQFEFSVSDKTSATVQLVAKGRDAWDVEASWAYLSHEVSDNLQARIGRIRTPLFMYSNIIDVGYAYPWTKPPAEIYGIGTSIENFEGIDLSWTYNTGPVAHMLTGYVGAAKLPGGGEGLQGLAFEINDMYGASLDSSWENFSTWISATTMNFDMINADALALINGLNAGLAALGTTNNLDIIDNPLLYWSLGAGYNNGKLRIDAEYIGYDWDKPAIVAAMEAAYISVAYRINKVTPYIVYSQNETTNTDVFDQTLAEITSSPAAGFFTPQELGEIIGLVVSQPRTQKSTTVGVAYALQPKVTLKFEAKSSSDLDGTIGEYLPSAALTSPGFDGSEVYSFTVDAVF